MSDFKDKFTLGVRSWKMRIILVWTLFPGGWAMTGPSRVAANLGGSLAVSCGYKPGYELFPKYWCRSGFLWSCFSYMAQTNGSEVTVTQGRVSIRDNHKARSFIVILGGVTPEDEGWYSCGVKRRLWFDLRHTTKVMVSAVVSTTMESRDVSPLTTNSLCPTACGEPPVWSQLGVTHLLVLLGVKVLMALALACGAAWVRSQRRNHNEENFQLFEHQQGTGLPTTLESQRHTPAPLATTLPGLCHPLQLPHARSCLVLDSSCPVKPQLLLTAPALKRGWFGLKKACIWSAEADN